MSSLAARSAFPRSAGRALALVAAAAVAAIGVVAVGRWEGARNARAEVRGMERVLSLVGPLDAPSLSGYRVLSGFDCLTYRRGSNPFALEVCVDPQGRVVETIDRRRVERRIASLRYEPAASTLRVDRAEVDRLLERMGAR